MGDYDVVKAVLGRIADMTWMQIAINRPSRSRSAGSTVCPCSGCLAIR